MGVGRVLGLLVSAGWAFWPGLPSAGTGSPSACPPRVAAGICPEPEPKSHLLRGRKSPSSSSVKEPCEFFYPSLLQETLVTCPDFLFVFDVSRNPLPWA